MRKLVILAFIFTISLGDADLWAQQGDSQRPTQEPVNVVSPDLLFNHILVYLKEGGPISGLFVGVEDLSLVLRTAGRDEKIPLERMAKVVIENETSSSQYGIVGMALGAYLGSIIAFRAEHQPAVYTKPADEWGTLLLETVFAAAGGGLGIFLKPLVERDKVVFDFSRGAEKDQAEWDRLRKFVWGKLLSNKVHLSFQGGKVLMGASDRYKSFLESSGYSIYRGGNWNTSSEPAESATDINLLREIQLTVSLWPQLDVGAALFFLGEPTYHGYSYIAQKNTDVEQSLSIFGYYAVGSFKPFFNRENGRVKWDVGIGIGAAQVRFHRASHAYSYYLYTPLTAEQTISRLLMSIVFFTELDLRISRNFSMGLGADRVFVPKELVIPPFPAAGLLEQAVNFGNASIGLTLGLHF